MTWVRIDDNATVHPKLLRLDAEALTLWLAGLCFCNRFGTNGHIRKAELPSVWLGKPIDANKAAALLCSVNLWEATANGWAIHDYEAYQQDHLERKREAGRLGGLASGRSRRSSASSASPSASEANEALLRSSEAGLEANEAVPSRSRSRPDPDPPRPSPCEEQHTHTDGRVKEVAGKIRSLPALRAIASPDRLAESVVSLGDAAAKPVEWLLAAIEQAAGNAEAEVAGGGVPLPGPALARMILGYCRNAKAPVPQALRDHEALQAAERREGEQIRRARRCSLCGEAGGEHHWTCQNAKREPMPERVMAEQMRASLAAIGLAPKKVGT